MIVKYKLIDGQVPNFIKDGGYFIIGDYLIGIGKPFDYSLLTKQELIDYLLLQHSMQLFQKPYEENITAEEIIEMVNNWCNERGESHDGQ